MQMQEAIQHLKALARRPQAPADVLAELGRSQINLGFVLRRLPQRTREAEATFREAIENLRILVERHPENRDYQYRLAVALLDLGNYLKDLPNATEDAVEALREANSRLSELCRDFPGIPLNYYELANSHNSLANSLFRVGDFAGVKSNLEQALAILDELQTRYPAYTQQVSDYHSLRGIVLGGLRRF